MIHWFWLGLVTVSTVTQVVPLLLTATVMLRVAVLQKNAGEVGIALNDLNERRTPVKDTEVTEVSVDLSLKELSVDKLDNLLEKIEGRRSDGVVKVTKLRVKTRFDHPEMLETGMTVSTWKSSGTTPAPSAGAPLGTAPPGAPRAPTGTVAP